MGNTQKSIDRVCEYRGLGKIKKGTHVTVDGRKGAIVGGNSSANFNVRWDDTGKINNCHPGWRMVITEVS